jgi:hypothetical protein
MQVPIKSLADLKRAVKVPDVVIHVRQHWQVQLNGTMRTPKAVRNSGRPGIQTNGYYFEGVCQDGTVKEMWAPIPKASELRFNADGTVTFHPNDSHSWTLEFAVPEPETICLCGAPLFESRCTVEDCVCSPIESEVQ